MTRFRLEAGWQPGGGVRQHGQAGFDPKGLILRTFKMA
jgi:hypothetical protein